MQRKIAIPIAIACAVISGLVELNLCDMFPEIDLGGGILVSFLLFCAPIIIGFAVFIILRNTKSRKRGIVIVVITLFVLICSEITIHPSYLNTHQNVWEEIYDYTVTFFKYPNQINYEDLALGNEPERVAALVKYKDSLPEKIVVITISKKIDEHYKATEWYWAELKDGQISYDHEKFLLIETSEGLSLITNPNNTSELKTYFIEEWKIERLFDTFPYGSSISSGIMLEDAFVDRFADDLQLFSGAEKRFYNILSNR